MRRDSLICHDCGRSLAALGVHIGMTHPGSVRGYRLRHGRRKTLIVCRTYHEGIHAGRPPRQTR